MAKRPSVAAATRGLALELLADLWSRFTHEVQSLTSTAPTRPHRRRRRRRAGNELAAFSEVLNLNEAVEAGAEGGGKAGGGGGGGGEGARRQGRGLDHPRRAQARLPRRRL